MMRLVCAIPQFLMFDMQAITIPNEVFFEEVMNRLSSGIVVQMKLVGHSMQPFLRDGVDSVVVEPVTAGEHVRVGDVFLYRYQGICLLHRLVRVCGDDYVMQGDNCYSVEVVLRGDICGRLIRVERWGKVVCRVDDFRWKLRSGYSFFLHRIKVVLSRCLNSRMRRCLAPFYFVVLALLMWAPVGALGIPLNNFVLGLRLDHLLHASVYLFCALFLIDWCKRRRFRVWIVAVLIGIITEFVQYVLPYRGFDVNDLLANFFGATIGWLLVLSRLHK